MGTRAEARYALAAEDRTKAAFRSVKHSLNDTRREALSLSSAIGALAGTAGFGALISASLKTADRIHKLSVRLGASTEALSELRHVANLSGVSFSTFSTSIQRSTRRIAEAAVGMGEARGALIELGLSAQYLASLAPEDQFEAIADAMEGVANQGDRVRLAMKLFDTEGVAMLQTMEGGAEAIRKVRMEAREMGLSLSRDAVEGMVAANDAMTRLKASTEALGIAFTADLAGPLVTVTDTIREYVVPSIRGAVTIFGDLATLIGGIGAALVMVARGEFKTAASIIDEMFAKIAGQELPPLTRFGPAQAPGAAPGGAGGAGGGGGGGGTPFDVEMAALTAQIESRFLLINQELMTEEERLKIHYENRVMIIEDAYVSGIIPTEERYFDLKEELEARHQKKINNLVKRGLTARQKFTQKGYRQQAATIFGELQSITAGVAQQNRALFELNKAAGIANAIINTFQGVSKTLATYPWPIAGVMAAAHAAAGLAQVQAIRSASFGAGAAAPSLAGAGAISGPVPVIHQPGAGVSQAEPVRQVNITLQGAGYSKQDIRELIEQINEEVGDGVILNAA